MEKINIRDLIREENPDENWLRWAMIELCVQIKDREWWQQNDVIECEVKLNGVEVKLSRIIKLMAKNLDKQLEERASSEHLEAKANKIAIDRFGEHFDKVRDAAADCLDRVQYATCEYMDKLGIKYED